MQAGGEVGMKAKPTLGYSADGDDDDDDDIIKALSRNTNKMQLCNRIYYSKVYCRLNVFRAAHHASSGALKLHTVKYSLELLMMSGVPLETC
jgi:hypothetical protein